jgi:hypothetical protein
MRCCAALVAMSLSALTAAGCGSSSEPPDDVLDPPPPVGGQQLTSLSYTVQPGEEKYFCYTYHSPADAERGITEVQPIQGTAVHHVALFQVFPSDPEPEGFFECNVLVKTNWQPIWAGGAGGNGLVLPEGVGFIVEPDTQYLVQYHIQNVTEGAITERSAINLRYEEAAGLTPAGIYALGSFSLTIPAGATDFQQITECISDRQMHVFAAFPHMHKLGKSITLETGPSAAEAQVSYAKDPWVFGDQPMDPMNLELQPGDYLRSTCTWDNPTLADVSFGESSDDEMCFMVVFYYPFTGLAGCVD